MLQLHHGGCAAPPQLSCETIVSRSDLNNAIVSPLLSPFPGHGAHRKCAIHYALPARAILMWCQIVLLTGLFYFWQRLFLCVCVCLVCVYN